MPGSVTAVEAQGQPQIPAAADFAVIVVGATTLNPLANGATVSPAYSQPAALASAWGLGDAVDCACQAVTRTDGNPAPAPVAICQTSVTTQGIRGELTTDDVTGTAVVSMTASTHPVGTYQPRGRVLDDGNNGEGGELGTTGIVIQFSPDDGRTWLPSQQLGTAFTLRMLIGGHETGVQYDFAPPTTNASYVALVAQLRAVLLEHFDATPAHADSDAASLAAVTLAEPTTVTEATAVVNQLRTAYLLHVDNITDVHSSSDHDNDNLPAAATSQKTGIDLAIALKDAYEAHRVLALEGAAVGLKAATATVASPVTLTTSDLLSAGRTAMNAHPRRLRFTTAGVTPANAPATATITGKRYGVTQTQEIVNLAQTAGSAVSTKEWDGTDLSIAYAAADGTAATIAIGYEAGIHYAADGANLVTAEDPSYGTLKTGDLWIESKTTPPMWAAVNDLFTAGPPATGAFAAIAKSSAPYAIIAITEPVAADDFPTLTAGLNHLLSFGKRAALLTRFRDPLPGETDEEYTLAFRTLAAARQDDRIAIVAGNGWLTDPFRGFVYFRNGMPAVLARMQSFIAVPGKRGERMAQHPGYVGRGPLENFSIVNLLGEPIPQAHDELVVGGIDGPINGVSGGITFYYQRLDTLGGTYVSEAPVMYPALSQILTWMDRRVANGIETVAVANAWTEIQGANIYDKITLELDQDIRDAIQTKLAKAIRDRYGSEFQNASDPNLVVIDPTVSVDGSKVTITGTVNWRPFGYTHDITLTFNAQR